MAVWAHAWRRRASKTHSYMESLFTFMNADSRRNLSPERQRTATSGLSTFMTHSKTPSHGGTRYQRLGNTIVQ